MEGFPSGTMGKNPPTNAGDTRDMGLIARSRRSFGGGNGNPFQYSYLENCMDRGVWQATVHGGQTHNAIWKDLFKEFNLPGSKYFFILAEYT